MRVRAMEIPYKSTGQVFILSCALVAVGPSPVVAKSKWKSKGALAVEGRAFSDDGTSTSKDYGLGLFGRLELGHKHRPFQQRVRLYGRLDQQDAGRTVLVVEEMWAEVKKWGLRLRVGADIVNWTATEAFHPADVINARNIDSDVENYEKVGEPMVSLYLKLGNGGLTAYFMPYYSRPILPSRASRLSFVPPGVVLGETLRLKANGRYTRGDFGPQGALRLRQSMGPADLSLHVIHQMDRYQPEVVFDADLGLPRTIFRTVTQLGGTLQYVLGDIILKVESAYRFFTSPSGDSQEYGALQDRDHLQLALGLEAGMVHDNGWESTFLLEGQSIFGVERNVRQGLHVFQNDALAGYRLAFNDVAGTEFLVSGILDIEDFDQLLLNASLTRRLGDEWRIAVAARLVFAPVSSGTAMGIQVPRRSDHLRLALTRYF